MQKITIIIMLTLSLLISSLGMSAAQSDSIDIGICGKAINENTEWTVTKNVLFNSDTRGTNMGFSVLRKGYSESTKYRTQMLDYDLNDWDIFGIATYNEDNSFREALLFSAPKDGGYSACGFNATTVFSVVPK
ncbi:MAG: hypothetical protein ACD_7C00074G0004 [uncultured bacterium]|nr:MAG: hypothetical protein ACD_7C00074G0004 [uncultured bacterium]OGO85330.1 MAG: hypothetical protein A2Y24_08455 [Clostridiales bacterium GWE2_32_10]HBR79010.1 hypothetical protein [Candidatus Moranbacteria bacterium]